MRWSMEEAVESRGGPGRPWWRIAEPTTTLTDVALALLTTGLGVVLLREGADRGSGAVLLWGGAFLATAASALLGAAVHGLAPWLAPARKRALWRATLVLVGVTNFLLAAAIVTAEVRGAGRILLLAAAAAKLLRYLHRLREHEDFRLAAIDSGVALLAVLVLEGYGALAGSGAGAGWISAGVLVSLAGAVVQRSGRGLHRHLNHNDLFHLFQMVAAYLLFRGGLLL